MYRNYQKQNERNFFFGRDNYVDYGRFVTYKSILSDDEIILRTNNVSFIHVDQYSISDILIVDNKQYVYLKSWQKLRVRYRDPEGNYKQTYLVKLNRNYFKTYHSKEPFPNISFQVADDFDSLYEHARLQGLKKLKVEAIWKKKTRN